MPGIKFNQLTREIEIRGSECFIESNFNKIEDLLTESLGEKMVVSEKAKMIKKPLSAAKIKESQAGAEIMVQEPSEGSPMPTAAKSATSEISHEIGAKRPPLRKYIRKEGLPGQQRIVIEVAKQNLPEISIASLKEKFGLAETKIGGIIREAEKLGKIRRVMNGSYSWT